MVKDTKSKTKTRSDAVLFIFSELAQTPETRRKIPAPTASTSSQTSPIANPATSKQVTVTDLTTDEVGEHFLESLAEKRRVALEESLTENQELYERIASLEDELNQSKSMLTEARSLVQVLTEMLEEKEGEDKEETEDQTEPEKDEFEDKKDKPARNDQPEDA